MHATRTWYYSLSMVLPFTVADVPPVSTAGNPTFQTPGIQTFAVNASISGADDRGRAASFPLWAGGGRRALVSALPNDTLPARLVGQYTPDQIRLMCVAEVRGGVQQ